MKKKATLAVALAIATASIGQRPWKVNLQQPEEGINLRLDLYEESIEVDGNIYGVWYVVSFDIKDDSHANVTIANDLGSEDQKLTLTQTSDSTYQLRFLGYNAVKRAQGKKLVKIPTEFVMKKVSR